MSAYGRPPATLRACLQRRLHWQIVSSRLLRRLIPVYPVPPSSTTGRVPGTATGTIGCPPGTAAGAIAMPRMADQRPLSDALEDRFGRAEATALANVVLTLTRPLPTPTNFVTGFWYSIWNTGTDPVTGLNNQWQITVNDSTHITAKFRRGDEFRTSSHGSRAIAPAGLWQLL